jgi:hypothetical protein
MSRKNMTYNSTGNTVAAIKLKDTRYTYIVVVQEWIRVDVPGGHVP